MSGSTFATGLIALVIGIILGVGGLAAVKPQLSPSAQTVAEELDAIPGPHVYGK